jgi:hypothetical protein
MVELALGSSRALEEQVRQKDLLLKEANYRVKSVLQIVSSILHLPACRAPTLPMGCAILRREFLLSPQCRAPVHGPGRNPCAARHVPGRPMS